MSTRHMWSCHWFHFEPHVPTHPSLYPSHMKFFLFLEGTWLNATSSLWTICFVCLKQNLSFSSLSNVIWKSPYLVILLNASLLVSHITLRIAIFSVSFLWSEIILYIYINLFTVNFLFPSRERLPWLPWIVQIYKTMQVRYSIVNLKIVYMWFHGKLN